MKFTLAAAHEPEDKRVLTESVLIESLAMEKDDPEFKKAIEEMVRSVYNMMDVSKEGHATYDEYRRAFKHYGVREVDFTKQAFEALDLNKDGFVSIDEFVIALMDYLFSDDENSPNNLLWGPLL